MSASRSKTPRSRSAAPARLEIVGRGTTSCVVRTGPDALVKIVTNPNEVEKEEVRALLLALDPEQRRLAGPRSVVVRAPTAAEREALRRCAAEMRIPGGDKMLPEVAEAAFVALPDAGESVGALKKRGARLTVAQVAAILVDCVGALELLHRARAHDEPGAIQGFAHGDVHEHNVAVRFAADGAASARLIDFGLTKKQYDPATGVYASVSGDVQGLVGVADVLLSLVDREAERARYECLRRALAAFRAGTKGLPGIGEIRGCVAEAPAGPAEAPAGPSRSPDSDAFRTPKRGRHARSPGGPGSDDAKPFKAARALAFD